MTETASWTTYAILALMKIKGVGRRSALKIADRPISTDDDRSALFDRAGRQKIDVSLLRENWVAAEEQVSQNSAVGIKALAYYDVDFPDRLRNIPDPPAVLFVKGSARGLSASRSLAVIGTREPTDYGERVAVRSAASAVKEGFVIVSGLAHGCDAFAHRGCVEEGGVGVAVLAHGLDKIYPAANKKLAAQLLEVGGCLVSEYPVGMAPVRTAFAERDRLQSGLSDGVLVIETDVVGGTMHTVRFARQQKRPLACIDHPGQWRLEPKTQGNQTMIAEKWAEPIADGEALHAFLSRLGAPAAGGKREDDLQTSWDFR